MFRHLISAIIMLVFRQVIGNITNLQFNIVHNISQYNYTFDYPTISKIHTNYLYVQQGYANIRKINLITGVQQGVYFRNESGLILDFVLFRNGELLGTCSQQQIVLWQTSNFSVYTVLPYIMCQNINYQLASDRLLWSQSPNQHIVSIDVTTLTQLTNHTLGVNPQNNKFYLSYSQQIFLNIIQGGSLKIGPFQNVYYPLSVECEINQTNLPDLQNRIHVAENLPFEFYYIDDSFIVGRIFNNSGCYVQMTWYFSSKVIAFKQMARVNNRAAYVQQDTRHNVGFIGDNNLLQSINFLISQNITGLQLSVDRRTIILILQTKILTYEMACTNHSYYDPDTFDCLPCNVKCLICSGTNGSCLSCYNGFYGQNCVSCHFSCQTCENSTGCLTCAINMTRIGGGLLCQAVTATDTQNLNETKVGLTQKIPEVLFSFFSIPSAFRAPIQSSIIIFIADFWIYSYHNRTYGQKVNEVFELIQTIENKKWSLMQFDKHLNISLSPLNIGLSNYSNYSNPKFLKVENKSSTLSESLLQFFVYMTPVVVLIFLLYRCIFNITFKYRISRHFRKYSLNVFLFFLLTEGNFEYICYCCFNQSLLVFFFNYVDRFNAVVWVLFFFSVIIYAFGIFYIVFWFYPKLSSRFIDEAYRFLPSFTIYTIIFNGKSFILAAIQSLLFSFYKAQLFAILGVYMFLVAILLYSQIKYGIFKRAIFFNFMLLQITIKILINFLFLIQYCIQEGENDSFDVLEDSLIITLYVWAIVILFQIIAAFFPQNKKALESIINSENQKIIDIEKKQQVSKNYQQEHKETELNQNRQNLCNKKMNQKKITNLNHMITFEQLEQEPAVIKSHEPEQLREQSRHFFPYLKKIQLHKMPNKTISPVCQLKIRDNNKIYKEEKEDPLLVVFKNKSK